jgi:hypothetical protein
MDKQQAGRGKRALSIEPLDLWEPSMTKKKKCCAAPMMSAVVTTAGSTVSRDVYKPDHTRPREGDGGDHDALSDQLSVL